MTQLKIASLKQGKIHYQDLGSGEVLLFVHGLFVDGRLWRNVLPALQQRYRCIVPTLPLGAHTLVMEPDADLSPDGVVRLLEAFMDHLGLDQVSLVASDTGGAFVQMLMAKIPHRIQKVVLTNCDAFEVFPPARFQYLIYGSRLPYYMDLMSLVLRIPLMRRLPFTLGDLTTRKPELLESWLQPVFHRPDIRKDLRKAVRDISRRQTLEAAKQLPHFHKPVLLAWGNKDTIFPLHLAHRLAETLPQAQLVWIENSRTLVPEDQPRELSRLIDLFMQNQPLPSVAPRPARRAARGTSQA